MKKKLGMLNKQMLLVTLIPILLLGVIGTTISYQNFKSEIYKEVETDLKHVSSLVQYTYDLIYPGDYQLIGQENYAFIKGEQLISLDYTIVDDVKSKTGIDVSIFYEDTRIITTLLNEDGDRLIGTGANQIIVNDVFLNKTPKFYSNALIDNTLYFAYCEPLINSDGSCIGMIIASKPATQVSYDLRKRVAPLIITMILIVIVAAFISVNYINQLIDALDKIKSQLSNISKGNLNSTIDVKLVTRNDELGDIARSTKHLQHALQELIELDGLTKLYNRRTGEKLLIETKKQFVNMEDDFCVAIGDIDFFKQFNDNYGHDCGDIVLKDIANILSKGLVGKGFVARWGGEEFLLVFKRCDLPTSVHYLEEILESVRQHEFLYKNEALSVTMTFGVTLHQGKGDVFKSVSKADALLYLGKESGRNCVKH